MTRRSWQLLVLGLLLAVPTRASASPTGVGLELGLAGGTLADVGNQDDRLYRGVGFFGGELIMGRRVGWSGSGFLELGATRPAGFAYGLELLPVGVGLRFAERGWLYARGGAGFDGSVGVIPFAARFPVALGTSFDVGPWLRLTGEARVAWVASAEARKGGSASADFADEAQLTAGFAIGRRERTHQRMFSDGTFVGVRVEEFGGVRLWSAIVAVRIQMETR